MFVCNSYIPIQPPPFLWDFYKSIPPTQLHHNAISVAQPTPLKEMEKVPVHLIQCEQFDIFGFWDDGRPEFTGSFYHPLTLLCNTSLIKRPGRATQICIASHVLFACYSLPDLLDLVKEYDESGQAVEHYEIEHEQIAIFTDGDTVYVTLTNEY